MNRPKTNIIYKNPILKKELYFSISTSGEVIKEFYCDETYLLPRSRKKVNFSGTASLFTEKMLFPFDIRLPYVRAIEELCDQKISDYSKYIRLIIKEFNKLDNHLTCLAMLFYYSNMPKMYNMVREDIFTVRKVFMMFNDQDSASAYIIPGGILKDIPWGGMESIERFSKNFIPNIKKYKTLLQNNIILHNRLENNFVLNQKELEKYKIFGTIRRASNITNNFIDMKNSDYEKIDFGINVGDKFRGEFIDCWDRFWLLCCEMETSLKVIKQVVSKLFFTKEKYIEAPKLKYRKGKSTYVCDGTSGKVSVSCEYFEKSKELSIIINLPHAAILKMLKHKLPGNLTEDLLIILISMNFNFNNMLML